MRKLLLTSTGFSNKNFKNLFLKQIPKDAQKIKVIFIPTAAIFDDAREVLPGCMQDLTDVGILPENIFIYHLGYLMSKDHPRTYHAGQTNIPHMFRLLSIHEMKEYNAVYFCGGDPAHLLNEINRTGFNDILKSAVETGLFYIGASAGSIVAAGNIPNNLGYLENELHVHCETGTRCGELPPQKIYLTDSQAIWIEGDNIEIIE
ncbi:MAG: Type 1 glutamine amidotransferase-like domain-containing protein [Eubacteriales bacterium]|nr:Type 1 glutamine amidotransferase-like domain-containing protein [Eubacteriales bacterium]